MVEFYLSRSLTLSITGKKDNNLCLPQESDLTTSVLANVRDILLEDLLATSDRVRTNKRVPLLFAFKIKPRVHCIHIPRCYGRAGSSAFTPKLVELVVVPGSTRRAEKQSPRIVYTAVAAPSVSSRALASVCLPVCFQYIYMRVWQNADDTTMPGKSFY